MAKKPRDTSPLPAFTERLIVWIDRWARPLRIAMATYVTLVVIVMLGYVMDLLILDQVYAGEISTTVPTLIITVLGVVTYGVGWWLLVGFDLNPDRPWQATFASAMWVILGAVGTLIILLALIFGYLFARVIS